MNKQTGMTLIELVIALAITAIIGMMSASILDIMIRNNQQITLKTESLANLQHSLLVIQNDLDQVALRQTSSDDDQNKSDLITSAQSSIPGLLIEFTRFRTIASLTQPFEKLERVRYTMNGDSLIRFSSPVALPASEDQWYKQTLLTNVQSAQIFYLSDSWSEELPEQSTLPLSAFRVTINSKKWQSLELISMISTGI